MSHDAEHRFAFRRRTVQLKDLLGQVNANDQTSFVAESSSSCLDPYFELVPENWTVS